MTDIRLVKPEDPEVEQLIAFHLSDMISNSPAESVHALNSSGLASPDITMFGAFENETCLSIGAVKTLSPRSGEIKSMRTKTEAIGRGLGKAILKHIIETAKQRGWSNLYLD